MRLNVNELKEQVKSMDIGLDLVRADGRLGNLVALAVIGDHGTIWTKTSYMSLKEMQCFLSGFNFCRDNNHTPKKLTHINKTGI